MFHHHRFYEHTRFAHGLCAPAFNNTHTHQRMHKCRAAASLSFTLIISETVAKSTQHASNALCVLAAARHRALNNNVYICYTEAKRRFRAFFCGCVCVSLFVRGVIMSVVLEDSVDWRWQQYTRHAHRTEGANGLPASKTCRNYDGKKHHRKVDLALYRSTPSRDTFRVPLDGCHIIVHEKREL